MRFQGLIMASSCRVEAGDRQMTVNLGQISSNRFHAVGEDSNPIPFAIHLQDCSTAVSQHVGVTFHGVADGKPDVLSVGEGPGIASGIGIALFDSRPAAPAQSSNGSLDITLPRTDDAKFRRQI